MVVDPNQSQVGMRFVKAICEQSPQLFMNVVRGTYGANAANCRPYTEYDMQC